MTDAEMNDLVDRCEAIYASRLQMVLEPQHTDAFVAIEPESGDYFLGTTLGEATRAARKIYPHRLTHAMRVGHRTALQLGLIVR